MSKLTRIEKLSSIAHHREKQELLFLANSIRKQEEAVEQLRRLQEYLSERPHRKGAKQDP